MEIEALTRHVTRLRTQGRDDELVEVKAAAKGLPKSLWESVSAFANTNGGLILLGLDEGSGFTHAPSFNAQALMDELRSGLDTAPHAHPRVTPVPPHQITVLTFEGHDVLCLHIEALSESLHLTPPCFVTARGIQNGSYKRVGDADARLTAYEIYALQTRRQQDNTDLEPLTHASISDLNDDRITDLLAQVRRSGSRALDGLTRDDTHAALRRLNIIDAEQHPTLAAFLTLGHYPQQVFPQLIIDVAVHPSTEKSLDPHVRFLDRQQCDGPIPLMIQDALFATMRNLRTSRVVEGALGFDVPEIPEDVLREAITNAVMHRDYSPFARSQQVMVDVFPDRVEITNPGGFWADRTAHSVLASPHAASRNSALAKLLQITPAADLGGTVAEDRGSGIPRMVAAMRAHGLPDPDYSRSDLDHVTVCLWRPNALPTDAVTTGLRSLPDRQQGTATVPPQQSHTARSHHHGLNATQSAIMASASADEPRTMQDLARASGRSLATARAAVHSLVKTGLLTPTAPPQSRHRAYLLTPAGTPASA